MPDDKSKEFQNIPEEKVNPVKEKAKKKDKIEELADEIKTKYGIDVEVVKNNKYKIKRTINYLLEHYEFRYDLFSQLPEYRTAGSKKDFEFIDDRIISNIHTEINYEAGIPIGKDSLSTLITSKYVSPDFDSIGNYINSLPNWDKRDRFPMFLSQITLKDDHADRDLLIRYFRKWFVTMVASLIDKNVINETAIVFSGEEGRGKTRFFNSLIPQHMRMKYFYSGYWNPRDKDHHEMNGTKMIIFLDEMETMTRVDSATLKDHMSQRYITVRRAYGHRAIQLYRRASFCGAINDDKFLVDTGANRRWLPFWIDHIEIDYDFDISLLYAQAISLFKDGFNIFFDVDEIDELKNRNEKFRRKSLEEELIALHWTIPTEEDIKADVGLQYLTPTDIIFELSSKEQYKKMNVNDTNLKRIGKVCRHIGFPEFHSKRLNGYSTPRDGFIMKTVDNITIESIKKGQSEDERLI